MLITNEFLEQFKPCTVGLAKFNQLCPNGLDSRSVADVRFAIDIGLDVGWAVVSFPEVFDTEDVICALLAERGYLLKHVKIPVTQKIVDIAIKSNINAFPDIPAEFQTEEMVCKILAMQGVYLKYVKIPITQKMVDIAIKNDINALDYVPEEYHTEGLKMRYEEANSYVMTWYYVTK